MQDAEYVLRFMTLYKNWETYSGSLSRSMDSFMLHHKDSSKTIVNGLEEDFLEAIERTHKLWGDVAFQRWDGQRWRQQALAGLFDAQMIAAASLTPKQLSKASAQQVDVIEKTRELLEIPEFEEAVRLGTNTPSRLRLRVSKIKDMLSSF